MEASQVNLILFGRGRRKSEKSEEKPRTNQILLLSTDRMNRSIFHISLLAVCLLSQLLLVLVLALALALASEQEGRSEKEDNDKHSSLAFHTFHRGSK